MYTLGQTIFVSTFLVSLTTQSRLFYRVLAVENEEALIVDSVAGHETSGQIPRGYTQQVEF